jgi:hypothetical protein
MALKLLDDLEIHQNFPSPGIRKYTKIGIFGMKVYHLATLKGTLLERHVNWTPQSNWEKMTRHRILCLTAISKWEQSWVARLFLVQNTKTGGKYTKLPQYIPKGQKIFRMAVK